MKIKFKKFGDLINKNVRVVWIDTTDYSYWMNKEEIPHVTPLTNISIGKIVWFEPGSHLTIARSSTLDGSKFDGLLVFPLRVIEKVIEEKTDERLYIEGICLPR